MFLDALYTQEYWLTEPLTLKGRLYHIGNYEIGRRATLEFVLTKDKFLKILRSNLIEPNTLNFLALLLERYHPIEIINMIDLEADEVDKISCEFDNLTNVFKYNSLVFLDSMNGHYIDEVQNEVQPFSK